MPDSSPLRVLSPAGRDSEGNRYYRLQQVFHFDNVEGGCVVSDLILDVGARLSGRTDLSPDVLVLPLHGEVCVTGPDYRRCLAPGSSLLVAAADTHWRVDNAGRDVANLLVIELPGQCSALSAPQYHDFSTRFLLRGLTRILFTPCLSVQVGWFGGRDTGYYQPSFLKTNALFHSVSGSIEVAEELLRDRDALFVPMAKALDFECLSPEATLLVVEVNA